MLDRIALGTAQFGLPYGISNSIGQTSQAECAAILSYAKKLGVRMLDTASAYGESETTLGHIGVTNWKVITKLPVLPEHEVDVGKWVDSQLTRSLSRLNVQKIHGLLLHNPDQLLSTRGQALYEALLDLRERGLVHQVGISIYSPDELDRLPPSMRFDIVQAPFNILDQRMITSGWADQLAVQGCEFHARSIFLQGLLLMPSGMRPRYFDTWSNLWKSWETWLDHNRLSAVEACLSSVLQIPEISKLVIGVNSLEQLTQTLAAIRTNLPERPADLLTQDVTLLNPALWKSS